MPSRAAVPTSRSIVAKAARTRSPRINSTARPPATASRNTSGQSSPPAASEVEAAATGTPDSSGEDAGSASRSATAICASDERPATSRETTARAASEVEAAANSSTSATWSTASASATQATVTWGSMPVGKVATMPEDRSPNVSRWAATRAGSLPSANASVSSRVDDGARSANRPNPSRKQVKPASAATGTSRPSGTKEPISRYSSRASSAGIAESMAGRPPRVTRAADRPPAATTDAGVRPGSIASNRSAAPAIPPNSNATSGAR